MNDIKKELGQMFITGISSTSLSEEEKRSLHDLNIGGVILFKRNYKDLKQLVSLIRQIYDVMGNPFIGVDQEGGDILRLSSPFTKFPYMSLLGKAYEKTHSIELACIYASRLCAELKACGINLCFVPVMDVLSNPENKVIGKRAFSAKKEIVSELGAAVIEEFKKNRVLSCAKHFPGHGDTYEDSHEKLPVLRCSQDIIRRRELTPFKRAIRVDVPLIMTAHIKYSEIDDKYPATLSKLILRDILRDELKFNNLIITDDMDMKAIIGNYGLEDAVTGSFAAGADISLICHSGDRLESIHEHVLRKAQKDPSLKENICSSIERVRRIKERYKIVKREILLEDAKVAFEEDSSDLVENMKRYS